MAKKTDFHYFFYFIVAVLILLGTALISAIVLYGNHPHIIYATAILGGFIVVLALIFVAYMKNKPTASEVFDLVPCRLNLKGFGKDFGNYCRRCNASYVTVGALLAITGFASTMGYGLGEKIGDALSQNLGFDGMLYLAIILIALLPIQATIFALKKKESNSLRIITGILFGVGVFIGGIYLFSTLGALDNTITEIPEM